MTDDRAPAILAVRRALPPHAIEQEEAINRSVFRSSRTANERPARLRGTRAPAASLPVGPVARGPRPGFVGISRL